MLADAIFGDVMYITKRRKDLTPNDAVNLIADVLFNKLSDEDIDNYEPVE